MPRIENRIKELRQRSAVTQEELGTAVGVSRQTIIAIEKGNYVPSLLLAMKLAGFFELPVEKIFTIQ